MEARPIDEAKMHAFGETLINDLGSMMLGNLAYIGDKLGLFKILAEKSPMTTEQLADAASCNPRYIREWLSAMAAGGWLEYDAGTKSFVLPPEHAPFLADETHPMSMGGSLECVVPMASVTPRILECFRNGGGVAFSHHHPDMPRVIERFTTPLFSNFLTRIWIPELLPEVHKKLTEGADVADVGCGSGRALIEMAKGYPKSRFTGFEPNSPSAFQALNAAKEEGLIDTIHIHNARSDLMKDGAYDLITTFDVVHDSVDPQALIRDVRRAIRADGTYLMLEINASEDLENNLHPMGKFFYSISTMYCMTVSLAHGGAGLGTCMGEAKPRQMCDNAGFSHFRKLDFEHPLAVLYEMKV
jgi:SAM-dependent methyltransferase